MKTKQTFSVITQAALSSDEWKVLGLLYQPIIGTLAFSLYHTMYHVLNQKNYQSEVFTHQFLMDLLGCKITEIKVAKEKLEAIALLETYQDEEHFIYQLKTPLTPRGFLKDTVLGQFLKTEVGPKMFQSLTEIFKVDRLDLSGFKQITKNFDDIFNFISSENYQDSAMYLGKTKNEGAKIKNCVNFEKFVELLPDRLKKPVLFQHQTQETIQKIAFVYGFDLPDLVAIYKETADGNGRIDINQLNYRAQNYYQSEHTEGVKIVDKKEPNKDDAMIHYLKTVPSIHLIEKYANHDYQLNAGDTIMQLIDRKEVEVGVINCLLMTVLKYKEGKLPHINYLDKVLETWMKKGITTTEIAYHELLKDKNKVDEKQTEQSNKKSKVKEDKNPDWVKAYLDELDNEEEL